MKRVIIVFACMILGGCVSLDVSQTVTKTVTKTVSLRDEMYEPVSIEKAKILLPFIFKVPNILPYTFQTPSATIRTLQEHMCVNIQYVKPSGKQDGFIELTVADFPYNMKLIRSYQLFDEEIPLPNGKVGYFRLQQNVSQSLLSLTWEDGLDYQLLYRYQEGDIQTMKRQLLQVVDEMDKT